MNDDYQVLIVVVYNVLGDNFFERNFFQKKENLCLSLCRSSSSWNHQLQY